MFQESLSPPTNIFTIQQVTAETIFSIEKLVSLSPNGDMNKSISLSFNKETEVLSVRIRPNFAMIVVGDDTTNEQIYDFFQPSGDVILQTPNNWRMPQILKALGSFKSASDAAKNGWNKDIPDGFSEHVIKVGKVKGVVCILKICNDSKS